LDQAESALYNLGVELKEKKVFQLTETVIADIRNLDRLERVFDAFRPEMVFHAAAYKHVPLMEENPSEAILTNVLGSKNLVDLSLKYEVDKFVFISTDKAVNPTNVMGASKRIAEIYAQSANQAEQTKFITTRFGNVLGSNGSVIPLFKKQIERGGPITVTDKNITRFFMTIPEAVQLVLEAESMGTGGEIFVFDMGESVKIYDLAKKMIKLSGLELDTDIQIKITGLRPGEKLFEELLTNEENTIPTHHPQILIAKVRDYNFDEIASTICDLTDLFETQDNEVIVQRMKIIVPEYKSKNSVFEKLDK
ncbi:polysaccharide biosynthesis protein, partial [Crocinitomix catalasitica]|nr:polysaccharide biosynthesis protein [Crocinitomix catalasitica]